MKLLMRISGNIFRPFFEVVVNEGFQLYGFDWEKIGVWIGGRLWEVVAYERWSHMEVRLYYFVSTA